MTLRVVTAAQCDYCRTVAQADGTWPHAVRALKLAGWIMVGGRDYCCDVCRDKDQNGLLRKIPT